MASLVESHVIRVFAYSTLPLGTNRTVSGPIIDSLGASAETKISVTVVLEADSMMSTTSLVESALESLSARDDDAMRQGNYRSIKLGMQPAASLTTQL
jgi:hypothetical protein